MENKGTVLNSLPIMLTGIVLSPVRAPQKPGARMMFYQPDV